jgi:hypothetical protein
VSRHGGVRTYHHAPDHLQTGSLAPAEAETAADALYIARSLAAQVRALHDAVVHDTQAVGDTSPPPLLQWPC